MYPKGCGRSSPLDRHQSKNHVSSVGPSFFDEETFTFVSGRRSRGPARYGQEVAKLLHGVLAFSVIAEISKVGLSSLRTRPKTVIRFVIVADTRRGRIFKALM